MYWNMWLLIRGIGSFSFQNGEQRFMRNIGKSCEILRLKVFLFPSGKMLYSCFPCDWMRNVIRSNCCKQEVRRFLKSVFESLLKGTKFVCFPIVIPLLISYCDKRRGVTDYNIVERYQHSRDNYRNYTTIDPDPWPNLLLCGPQNQLAS